MGRRCCLPPERLVPDFASLSFTSSHNAALRSVHSTRSPMSARECFVQANSECDALVDAHREGGWFLEDHADLCAQGLHVATLAENVLAVEYE